MFILDAGCLNNLRLCLIWNFIIWSVRVFRHLVFLDNRNFQIFAFDSESLLFLKNWLVMWCFWNRFHGYWGHFNTLIIKSPIIRRRIRRIKLFIITFSFAIKPLLDIIIFNELLNQFDFYLFFTEQLNPIQKGQASSFVDHFIDKIWVSNYMLHVF